MESNRKKVQWFACENGHPVAAGSTVCIRCGSQVTSKEVPGPRETSFPAPASASPEAAARIRAIVMASIAASVLTVGAATAVLFMSNTSSDSGPVSTTTPEALSCDDVAGIEVGREYQDAPAVFCFTVDGEEVVSISATSTAGEALSIEVERVDGVFWAASRGAEGMASEVASSFLPGTYLVRISGDDGTAPGPYTLVTDWEVEVPWNGSDPSLPGLEACGTPEVPWLDPAGGTVGLDLAGTPHACLHLEDAAFVRMGIEPQEGNPADLGLAVHAFDGSGRPVFLRSVNDAFGLDPEMSVDLEAGDYLLEVGEWTGAPIGEFRLYASVEPGFVRQGDVSLGREGLRASDCDSGVLPELRIGRSLVFTENDPIACLTVSQTQRLILRAVSFSGQDLTLEVIGFDEAGLPVRRGWVDDYLWADDPDALDPVLDTVLPAGVYVLVAAEFGGEATQNLLLAVDPVDP